MPDWSGSGNKSAGVRVNRLMRTRSILLLATFLAIAAIAPWSWRSSVTPGAAGIICPTDAKTANLDFALKNVDGKTIRLADYRGKVLLLDFWATWCGPCKIEIPGFVDLYDKYRSRGFEVAGVVVLDEFKNAAPFAERYKMNYPVLDGNDREDLESAFGPVIALPTSLLINREGKICSRHVGLPPIKRSDSLQKAVEEAFEVEIRSLL